ncbi:Aldehyde dehydrogenase family 2 member C4 [Acorus calamus]|uniref:Aldehyde dehydrogenase family 2 member C4 n=1 Tax=Acorus calamus TaxID=4465 RepID=A0AAV9EIQ0_ACOCL|nr:Aldehyde dehydrogenase family 2 member C4 [Acorus calamus]
MAEPLIKWGAHTPHVIEFQPLECKTFKTFDPRTGEVIARVAEGDKEDINLAVKIARQAFDHGKWPRMPESERGRIMLKFADLIDENVEELAKLDSLDARRLLTSGMYIEIPYCTRMLRYNAGFADKIHGETLKMSREFHAYTLKEPVGVVGLVIPWNFPSTMFFSKVSPALAAGCTIIVKPAEQTPLSALFIAQLAKTARIPDGVLNVVTGFGPTAGAALCSHMDVDKVSNTISLELGGKSPFIVFDDADADKAVDLAHMAIFYNKVDKNQFEKILRYIDDGKEDEATLLTGGKACGEKGYYIEPTIFTNVKISARGYKTRITIVLAQEDMRIAKDEIFRPTVEEAIEKANNTRYGLAVGIVTKDIDVASRVSRSVRAGTVWINCYFAFDSDAPFGGVKMSGFGKDGGLQGLEKYQKTKTVVTPIYNSPWL